MKVRKYIIHKSVGILFSLLFCFFGFSEAQHISFAPKDIICYESGEVHKTALYSDFDFNRSTNGRLQSDNIFEVTYFDVPPKAVNIIEYATQIWSQKISTNFPIKISITFTELSDGVLGSARPGSYEVNFEGAPQRNIRYPIALAERMVRRELNEPDEFEIVIRINSTYAWHYSVTEPINEEVHDLLSVVLHEIGHGLGLADTFRVNGSYGSFGGDPSDRYFGRPNFYDSFIYNEAGKQLITEFENNSTQLEAQLTSGRIEYGGRLAYEANDNVYPQIYAPNSFNSGSSISHLDESTFPAGNINSLMTPKLSRGEIVHVTGPIVDAMLAEMGYVYAFVDHEMVDDQSDINTDALITGTIKSDSLLNSEECWVVYSFDNFLTEAKVLMELNGTSFTATIPAPGFRTYASFYFDVMDVNGLKFRNPINEDLPNYTFGFGLIAGLEDNNFLKVYPNPTTGKVNIELNESIPAIQINVQDVRGNLVYKSILNENRTIDLSELNSGLYIVSIFFNDKNYLHRVIVQ